MKNKRILFMGTPEIAATILKGIIEEGYNVVAIVAQEDKPVGRKKIIQPVPTKIVANTYNIPVFQPHRIKYDFEFVKELKIDLIVTCAYGQLLPKELLSIPSIGCVNIHGSLLPKYRGASPIQQSLISGDEETGVTIIEMVEEMDAGQMFNKKSILISPDDNYTSLYDKIASLGLEAILESLPRLLEGNLCWGEEQCEELVTKCGKIKKEDEHLSLDYSCVEFINWVRGLSNTPGGYLLLDDQVFKIYKAKKYSDKISSPVGEIVQANKQGLVLQLKDGQVALIEVQKQGKAVMDYKSFINGNQNILGKILK